MVITQDENCHNDGVARPPILDNDHDNTDLAYWEWS